MDNFNDSLTSSGTENDPFVPNIRHNPKELGTANGTGHSTPLSKLKVSASFADKLPQKEVPFSVVVAAVGQQAACPFSECRLCFVLRALGSGRVRRWFLLSARPVVLRLWVFGSFLCSSCWIDIFVSWFLLMMMFFWLLGWWLLPYSPGKALESFGPACWHLKLKWMCIWGLELGVGFVFGVDLGRSGTGISSKEHSNF
ncbi:CBM_collapsed_G0043230.mRNA.1.CDS.1 [Saccharomyces cerevisiae]|nr:CBM_collapsed_G0043230.mRNA.1.CDS.1 [Saccharomyces cerevisiae]